MSYAEYERTEHSFISQQGKAKAKQLSIAADAAIPGLTELVRKIHQHDTKTFAQLNHAGSATTTALTGCTVVAPSAVELPIVPPLGDGTLPQALTKGELANIVEQYVQAALRAKQVGYDGVEIHSAHGYLLNEFYSPLTNQRTDEYGADSLQNRLRLHCEVLHAVRAAVGETYPISVRFGGCDYREGGSTVEDAVAGAQLLQQAGADMLSISGGMCRYTRQGHTEPGYFKDLATPIKAVVGIPVLLTGGVTQPQQAEGLLAESAADMIGVGRALFKNPTWPGGNETETR